MKLKRLLTASGFHHGWAFRCPGCENRHHVGAGWEFNGDMERPTFNPSVLVRYYDGDEVKEVCHSYIRNGLIIFLDDCTHSLAGCTVPLPDFSD